MNPPRPQFDKVPPLSEEELKVRVMLDRLSRRLARLLKQGAWIDVRIRLKNSDITLIEIGETIKPEDL